MKNLKVSELKPLTKTDHLFDRLQATQEFNSVPLEIMADIEVREVLAQVSPEVREKIIKGLPF